MELSNYKDKRICVAVSGGADSTALLHYLKTNEKRFGYQTLAVHFQHGIRGEESVADMRFVQSFCLSLGVEVFVFEGNCLARAKQTKQSVETAARNFRREGYEALLSENKADYIATAHHQDDEAETVLFRIARGAALAGAGGMREEDGRYLRPFLTWSKADILAYVKKNGLTYCEDRTNYQTDYTRNKLRLTVFPALCEAVQGAKENFARFGRLAAEDDEYLQRQSSGLLSREGSDGRETRLVSFCQEAVLFRRAALLAMKQLGCDRDYTAEHLECVFALQGLERGARITLPKGVEAEKTERGIRFYRTAEKECLPPVENRSVAFSENGFCGSRYAVNVSFTPFDQADGEWRILRLDMDKLPASACFRFRREGDEITVFGGGTKSLKKLLNERKIPVAERAYLPVVADEKGVVYAVCGVEIADSVKVTESTKRMAYLQLQKK